MAFDPILIQGENLTPINGGGDDSLIRTTTQNWERDGSPLNPEPNITPNNPNNQEFDALGLRPDYTGDGYFDINGNSGLKATYTFSGLPAEATSVDVYIRVANGSAGTAADNLRGITVAIDGVSETIASTQTSQFFLWGVQKITLALPDNLADRTLTITTSASNGPNIDAIAIVEAGTAYSFLPPEITSPATLSLDENTLFVGTVVASDLDQPATSEFAGGSALSDETLTYSIVPGDDGGLFVIDAATGDLSFLSAPDFETDPGPFTLTVQASDGALLDSQTITVNVLDVAVELPSPTIAPIIVQAEDAVIASGNDDVLDTIARTQTAFPETGTGKDGYGLWIGYGGAGYIDFNNDGSGIAGSEAITFEVNVTEAGLYDLHVRFMSATSNRPLDIGVNGALQIAGEAFVGVGFGTWLLRTPITLQLDAGPNTITLAIPEGITTVPTSTRWR